MRTHGALLAGSLLLALSTPVQAQKNVDSEETINRIITSGLLEGHDSKVVAGTGDGAAVTVTKIVRGRNLSPNEIDRVLLVLKMAFGSVAPGPQAEPRTALFVMRALELSTNDALLRDRIAQTRKYVEEEFSKSKNP